MSDASVPPNADGDETLSRTPSFERKERARQGWGPLVLILVLLLPLSAAGWVAWQQIGLQRELAALRADNAALQQASASGSGRLEQQLQQSQQELGATLQQELSATLQQELGATLQQTVLTASRAAAAEQADRLAALESELATFQRELAETRILATQREAVGAPLAEAEMLLRFAQQRVLLARDTSTAIALMQAADDLLLTVEDTSAYTVRDALANELAALQAVPAVDVAGLFAQLSAQSARVENFSAVSAASAQDFAVAPPSADTADTSDWWGGLKQVFGTYFVVSSSTADIEPQLGDSEQFLLRALVQLQIEEAKLALVQAEPQLYEAALDAALGTARRWLRSDDAGFDEFVAAIEVLRDTPIVADIPATGQALSALRLLSGSSNAGTLDTTPLPAPGSPQ